MMEESFREILEMNGDESAGILPMKTPSTDEEVLELENA